MDRLQVCLWSGTNRPGLKNGYASECSLNVRVGIFIQIGKDSVRVFEISIGFGGRDKFFEKIDEHWRKDRKKLRREKGRLN
jgi:hypothetical protein